MADAWCALANHIDTEYSLPGVFFKGVTDSIPLIKYLKIILSEDEAKLAAQVPKQPLSVEAIGKKVGRSDFDQLEKELWTIADKGVLYVDFLSNGKKYYSIPFWAPGIIEYMIVNMERYPGVAEVFNDLGGTMGGA
ncbi:MAG: hypothetical protein Q4C07_06610, partial [Eubacteriales bacterium]|nr:hypothetical protein [Eubacteriales bacterium]